MGEILRANPFAQAKRVLADLKKIRSATKRYAKIIKSTEFTTGWQVSVGEGGDYLWVYRDDSELTFSLDVDWDEPKTQGTGEYSLRARLDVEGNWEKEVIGTIHEASTLAGVAKLRDAAGRIIEVCLLIERFSSGKRFARYQDAWRVFRFLEKKLQGGDLDEAISMIEGLNQISIWDGLVDYRR